MFTFGERGAAVVPIRGTHEARSRDVRWLDVGEDVFPSVHDLAVRSDGLVVGSSVEIRAIDPSTGKLRYAVTAPWKHSTPSPSRPTRACSRDAANGSVSFVDTSAGRTLAQHASPGDAETVVWDARGRRTAFVYGKLDVLVCDGLAPLCRLGAAPRRLSFVTAPGPVLLRVLARWIAGRRRDGRR